MTDKILQHRRVHNLLLIQKLLSVRGDSSPFTLVLDTIEQTAKPLINHYIHNAKISKTDIVFISFETPKPPQNITTFIKARRKPIPTLQKEILSTISPNKRTLLIIDTLHPLALSPTHPLPTLLSTLLTPQTSLLATYHTDIPLSHPRPSTTNPNTNPYAPTPLTLLKYLATTIFTTHSFSQTLARKRATDKSMPEPVFGLAEERDGVVVGKGANEGGRRGMVVEMEYRRKSGRGVEEVFWVPRVGVVGGGGGGKEKIVLLDDHPAFARGQDALDEKAGVKEVEEGMGMSTFDLGITERQRREREGVVLPYFDAQSAGGGGGGRILYDMGAEDDFDEEEDEI